MEVDQYDTPLTPEEEAKFKVWKQKYAPNDTGGDYDLRGAFKAGLTPDPERGHFPDTFKKPNHPTFSVESQYSKGDTTGGKWEERNGKTVFVPSQWNLKTTPADKLKAYFQRVEPDAILDIPTQAGDFTIDQKKALAMAAARKRMAEAKAGPSAYAKYGKDALSQIPESEFARHYQADVAGGKALAKSGIEDVTSKPGATGGFGRNIAGVGKIALGEFEQIPPVAAASAFVQDVVGDPTRNTMKSLGASDKWADYARTQAETLAGALGPAAVGKVAGGAADAVTSTSNALRAMTGTPAQSVQRITRGVATSDDVKQVASSLYKQADDIGGTLKPGFTNQLIDEARSAAPQTRLGKMVTGENEVTKFVSRLDAARDEPMTLQEAQEIDEHLGDLIDKEYKPTGITKQGLKLEKIQDGFRDRMLNADETMVEGGPAGFQALKNARMAWHQAMKMRDIEKIATRAKLMEQPVTGVRTGIRQILSNPAKRRGYTDEELAALQKAHDMGTLDEAVRVMGSRLIPMISAGIGAGLGHIPGAIVGEIVGTGLSKSARNIATNRQLGKLDDVLATMATPVSNLLGSPAGPSSPGMNLLARFAQTAPQTRALLAGPAAPPVIPPQNMLRALASGAVPTAGLMVPPVQQP